MESLSFNLSDSGSIIDIRHMFYPMDYYLISDINNINLVSSIITPLHWRYF